MSPSCAETSYGGRARCWRRAGVSRRPAAVASPLAKPTPPWPGRLSRQRRTPAGAPCAWSMNISSAIERAARMGRESAGTDGCARVSVILPAHNEAATIAAVVRDCQAAGVPFDEIIVIDDGSVDRTADAAEEAGARVIRLGHNHGK